MLPKVWVAIPGVRPFNADGAARDIALATFSASSRERTDVRRILYFPENLGAAGCCGAALVALGGLAGVPAFGLAATWVSLFQPETALVGAACGFAGGVNEGCVDGAGCGALFPALPNMFEKKVPTFDRGFELPEFDGDVCAAGAGDPTGATFSVVGAPGGAAAGVDVVAPAPVRVAVFQDVPGAVAGAVVVVGAAAGVTLGVRGVPPGSAIPAAL